MGHNYPMDGNYFGESDSIDHERYANRPASSHSGAVIAQVIATQDIPDVFASGRDPLNAYLHCMIILLTVPIVYGGEVNEYYEIYTQTSISK
jgi:hypothetical protein